MTTDPLAQEAPPAITLTLSVSVHPGAYWPTHIYEAVQQDENDPWKDDASRLVRLIMDALSRVPGVSFDSATTTYGPPAMSATDAEDGQYDHQDKEW